MKQESSNIVIRPYSPAELAGIYGVSVKTLYKWMAAFTSEIGERRGRYFTALQVARIMHRLGIPGWADMADTWNGTSLQ